MDTQHIAKKVRDQSYFEDARIWYFEKYVLPISERSFTILLAIFCIAMATMVGLNIRFMISVPQRIPFILYVENSLTQFSYLQPLGNKKTPPQEAIARFLITDYIRSREEFIPRKMDSTHYPHLLKRIKSSSSKTVLNEFKHYMSNMNPYSPFIRYHDNITREINIKHFQLLSNDLTTGKAVVQFEATEKTPGKEDSRSTWEVLIHYRLPDIENVARTQAPLRFLVKYYKVKLIKE